ncbi:MAG: beta-lactamase family protein [Saprospiraceae bacterium]|nr:beta-lactamase family protein [Saprospiraceae bacterium]
MFQTLIENKKLAGANCVFWKDGDLVYQDSQGYRNLNTRQPMTVDTIFRISSMTKPVTSVLAMMLLEESKLDLTDPVTKWFPEFEKMKVRRSHSGEFEDAIRPITILDLLTHRAGFTYSEFLEGTPREDYQVLGGDIDSELTTKQWIQELAGLPLVSQPGNIFNYGRSTDLLGILIATIEEKTLGRVMEEKIFGPLGMSDTFFDVPGSKKNRCAADIGFDESGHVTNLETVPLNMAFKNRPAGLEYQSGGQGLWSTIGDYLQFAKIFLQGGHTQLLKPETIDLMCTNHLTPSQRADSRLMGTPIFKENYGFGLGLATVCSENAYETIPCAGSKGSVGWPGAYGGWWSADPNNNTVAIFMTHSMTTPGQLAQGIGFELYEAIDLFINATRNIIN